MLACYKRRVSGCVSRARRPFQAYDSQLRLIDSLRERGELRLRSLPGYSGHWGRQPAHAFNGLVPYLGEGVADVAVTACCSCLMIRRFHSEAELRSC